MVVQKKVPSVEALERLHRLAYSVPDEVQVRSLDGAIAIDAKSSMGLFALDFSQPLKVITDSLYVIRMVELDLRKNACAAAVCGAAGLEAVRTDGMSDPIGFAVFYRSLLVISGEISCSAFRVWQGSERHGRAEGKDLGYHICPDFFIGCSFIWGGLCPLPAFLDGGRRCSGAFGSCTCAV